MLLCMLVLADWPVHYHMAWIVLNYLSPLALQLYCIILFSLYHIIIYYTVCPCMCILVLLD
jgi:hypothetical protein